MYRSVAIGPCSSMLESALLLASVCNSVTVAVGSYICTIGSELITLFSFTKAVS